MHTLRTFETTTPTDADPDQKIILPADRPGWYSAPYDDTLLRWWDGYRFTGHTRKK